MLIDQVKPAEAPKQLKNMTFLLDRRVSERSLQPGRPETLREHDVENINVKKMTKLKKTTTKRGNTKDD